MKLLKTVTYKQVLKTLNWIVLGTVLPLSISFAVPPTVAIDTPATSVSITKGQELKFTGHASDGSSGNLTGNQLVWSSNRDGSLGKGASINAMLSAGEHTVTLNATNSYGESALASVTISVGH